VTVIVCRMCERWIKVADIEMLLDCFSDDLKQSVVRCICTRAFIK